jgi:hypothetical protein
MKKLLTKAALIAAIIVIASCEKENPQAISSPISSPHSPAVRGDFNVSVKDGRLVFPTKQDLEGCQGYLQDKTNDELNSWESGLGFISKRKNALSDNKSQWDDKYFMSVVNTDNLIQVGDTIYNIQPDRDSVWFLKNASQATGQLIASLVNRQVIENRIEAITAETAILDDPEYRCSGAPSGNHPLYSYYLYPTTTDRVEASVRYFTAGVWFSLVARCEHQTLASSGWYNSAPSSNFMQIGMNYVSSSWKRCSQTTASTAYNGAGYWSANQVIRRPYYSISKLKNYSMSASFYYRLSAAHNWTSFSTNSISY